MKKALLIISAIICTTTIFAQNANYKVFPFKTGIIEYKQEGNAKGTHTKYIDQYGYKQADYTESEVKVFGFTNKEKKGIIMIGPKVYSIDFSTNRANVGVNPVYETYANSNGSDYDKLGKEAMESLGFSNSGKTETIVGKKCEIWKGALGRIWIWKSLALKSETVVLGINITETAVSVKINTSVPASKFEVPNGIDIQEIKTYNDDNYNQSMIDANSQDMSADEKKMMEDAMNGDMEGMMSAAGKSMSQEEKDQIHKIANMSYSEFKKMIKREEPNISEEEIKEAYNMTKKMAKYIK